MPSTSLLLFTACLYKSHMHANGETMLAHYEAKTWEMLLAPEGCIHTLQVSKLITGCECVDQC